MSNKRTNFSFAPNHYTFGQRAPHFLATNDGVDCDNMDWRTGPFADVFYL